MKMKFYEIFKANLCSSIRELKIKSEKIIYLYFLGQDNDILLNDFFWETPQQCRLIFLSEKV